MKPIGAAAAAASFAIGALTVTDGSAQNLRGIDEVTIVEAVDSTVPECRIGEDRMRRAMQSVFEAAGLAVRSELEGPALTEDGSVRQPIRVRMGNVASYDRKRNLCYGYFEFQVIERTGLTGARLAAALDTSAQQEQGRVFGDVEIAKARITGAFAPGDYQRLVWPDVFASMKRFAARIGREAKS